MYSDATLLAQAPSSVHQPISNLTRPDGYACGDFLGKRCTTLNHGAFDFPTKPLDNNAKSFKGQTLAIYVNTRHMALYHPNASGSHDQLASVQDLSNQFFSIQESLSNSSTGGRQEPIPKTNTMEMEIDISSQNTVGNAHAEDTTINFAADLSNPAMCLNTNTPTFSNNNASTEATPVIHTRQQQKHKPYDIFLPKKPERELGVIASNSQTTVKHVNTKATAQMKPMGQAQRWTNALKHIQNARRNVLWSQLFGDELTSTPEIQSLLRLLMDIDNHKNLVTLQEEQVTGLTQEINKVLETCSGVIDKESIKIAHRILKNFRQRFY